jgi:hypothetical protein
VDSVNWHGERWLFVDLFTSRPGLKTLIVLLDETTNILCITGQTEGDIGYDYNGGYEEEYDEEEVG